ncbi:hypothetical protein [Streptomyces cadmiisoli]|uniref:hypothetical protein n=1 Tax=Streptomyces cadmiisoli TaxID=2184053 RepID=UPI00364E1FED
MELARHETDGLEPTDADARLKHCSDLLDDFHQKIRQMESEYLRAMMGLYDSSHVGPENHQDAYCGRSILNLRAKGFSNDRDAR